AARARDPAIKNLYKEAEDAGIEIDLTATVLQRVYKFQLLAAQPASPDQLNSADRENGPFFLRCGDRLKEVGSGDGHVTSRDSRVDGSGTSSWTTPRF
ncbi:hypothetical protein OC834_007848, partial [Tilletia horrida]